MKAVILAAGLGTRLRPLTDRVPKALVPVLHRPALLRVADRLRASGVATLCVNAHHFAEQVARALPDAVVAREPALLDSGGGIAHFRDLLETEDLFLVHNCDVYSTLDLARLVEDHRGHRPAATLALVANPATDSVLVEGERIVQFGPPGPGRLTYSGVAVLTGEVLRHLERGRPFSLTDAFRALLREGRILRAHRQPEAAWCDLGSLQSYLLLHRDLLTGSLPWPDPTAPERPWSVRAPLPAGVRLEGWGCISSGALVHAGARVRDSVVLPGASVRGFLDRSIAGPFGAIPIAP